MKTQSSLNPSNELQSVIGGLKDILTHEGDLNLEKENIQRMIDQADFLVGKHDDFCERFFGMLSSMVNFDFSKKLTTNEEADNNIENMVSQGLNMLNEEFKEKAINKRILYTLLDSISFDRILIITDNKNNIIFARGNNLPDFREEDVIGLDISSFFNQYELLVHLMRAESLTNNINLNMTWKDSAIPASIKIRLTMRENKIEGVTYLIEIPKDASTMK